LVEKDGVLMEE